jgi:MFS family permease
LRWLSGRHLIVVMCLAEILGMASFAMFPALMPGFIQEWSLSNTEAGWINGLYFIGYTVAVPVLVSLTDRIDPRHIYLTSAAVTSASAIGFAIFAEGFWSALILRTIAGVGLAGTYMPGLKALSDRFEGPTQSRAVAVYTASFGVGTSVSFALAGELAGLLDWQGAFVVGGVCGFLGLVIVGVVLAPAIPKQREPGGHLLDFRPVFRNRPAMGYMLAYAAHNWELFGLRSWIVAFLVYAQSLQQDAVSAAWWSPPLIAAAINLIGWPASVFGNELAVRFGRQRIVIMVMTISALYSCLFGFTASWPFVVIVAMALFYGLTVTGDSASITAGVVAAAQPEYRGATMAAHSCVGFAGASIGPIVFGIILDLAGGGTTTLGWGLAFIVMGLGVLMGPIAIALLSQRPN